MFHKVINYRQYRGILQCVRIIVTCRIQVNFNAAHFYRHATSINSIVFFVLRGLRLAVNIDVTRHYVFEKTFGRIYSRDVQNLQNISRWRWLFGLVYIKMRVVSLGLSWISML